MLLLLLTAWLLYIMSHYSLAKAKGYSGWLALLGLVKVVGLLILLLLPSRASKRASTSQPSHIDNRAAQRTDALDQDPAERSAA